MYNSLPFYYSYYELKITHSPNNNNNLLGYYMPAQERFHVEVPPPW